MGFDRIGFVVGLAAEAKIARSTGWPVAVGGGTAEGAEAAAHGLILKGAQALISFGFAGGLDPALRRGTIVVPEAVRAGERLYLADAGLAHTLGGFTASSLLGADVAVASPEDKRRLFCQTHAVAVDLESAAAARVAERHAIPFAVLRAICDPADRWLPPVAIAAVDARGRVALGRVVISLFWRPHQLPAVFRLASDAAAARRSLIARVSRLPAAPAQQFAPPMVRR